MSFSNTFENRVLTWVFTASAATRPTSWHVALFASNPAEDGSGTEVSGGGYARQSATFTGTVPLARSGSFGYTVRVTPCHELLAHPAELGLVAVAEH